MTIADFIVRFLADRGVSHVFELSGGMITPLLDAAARAGAPKLISMHHEQAAGFAAEGWARMTGVPGVAFATSGPGATNLLTTIGSCYFDGTPAVFITGQVPTNEQRGLRYCRQIGFQETDIVEMAQPVTKLALRVEKSDIANVMEMAFDRALSGRPGPVLLDIPFDVQRREYEATRALRYRPLIPLQPPSDQTLQLVADAMRDARRPLVLLGNGAHAANASAKADVRRTLERLWIPCVYSLHGKDLLPSEHPLNAGFIGSYGNRWANWALANCDALLVLGSRLDVRQTGADVAAFTKGKSIIQVDIDADEMNARVRPNLAIQSSVASFCAALDGKLTRPGYGRPEWREAIGVKRSEWPAERENAVPQGVNPNEFLRMLGEASAGASAYVVDVGAHQMYAAQSLPIREGQRFLTSGGMGAMGFALPAAIGVAVACPGKPVVAIMGDGGFQINSGALHTIAALNLPVKIVVLNNGGHRMVSQFQDELFEGRRTSTMLPAPSFGFAEIAEAYGVSGFLPHSSGDSNDVICWLMSSNDPRLLELVVSPEASAFPKLRHGKPLDRMYPEKS